MTYPALGWEEGKRERNFERLGRFEEKLEKLGGEKKDLRTSLRILNLLDALDSAALEAGEEDDGVSEEASLEATTSGDVVEGEGSAVDSVEDEGVTSPADDDGAASEELETTSVEEVLDDSALASGLLEASEAEVADVEEISAVDEGVSRGVVASADEETTSEDSDETASDDEAGAASDETSGPTAEVADAAPVSEVEAGGSVVDCDTVEDDSEAAEDEEAGSVEGAGDSELTVTTLGGPTSAMISSEGTAKSVCASSPSLSGGDARSIGRSSSCRLTCLGLVPLAGPLLDLKCPFPTSCPTACAIWSKTKPSRSKGSIENG